MRKNLRKCLSYLIVSLGCILVCSACKDDDDNGPSLGPDGKRLVQSVIEKSYTDGEEGYDILEYYFSYDGEGRVKSIELKTTYTSGEDGKKYTDNGWMTFSREGKTLKVVSKYYDGELQEDMDEHATYELNEDLYIVSGTFVDEFDEGDEETYSFTYNDEGYLIENTVNRNRYTYGWSDGDMTKGAWSRGFVYNNKENKAGFDFTFLFDEGMIDIDENYLFALGYMGKINKHLLQSSSYDNYEYTFYNDGLVKTIKETPKNHSDYYTTWEISYN